MIVAPPDGREGLRADGDRQRRRDARAVAAPAAGDGPGAASLPRRPALPAAPPAPGAGSHLAACATAARSGSPRRATSAGTWSDWNRHEARAARPREESTCSGWHDTPAVPLILALAALLAAPRPAPALPVSTRSGAISARPTPRCWTATACCCSACAPTPSVRRGDWIALADMSPALRSAMLLSEDKRFYEHSGVDWRAVVGRGLGQPLEHPHRAAPRHHDAARRPARRRPAARRRRPQPGAEAGPDGRRPAAGARSGARTRSSRPTSTSCPSAARSSASTRSSRTLFGKAPHGLDAREAAVAAALVRAPNARPALVAQRACERAARRMAARRQADCEALDMFAQRRAAAARLRSERRHRAAPGTPRR